MGIKFEGKFGEWEIGGFDKILRWVGWVVLLVWGLGIGGKNEGFGGSGKG